MDNNIHTSETGFIVSKSPNVNAVYGPWESLELARSYLESQFVVWDSNFNEVVNVPTGTTVAIYNDSSKHTVTEYWWSDDNLVLKTYGNNYLSLIILNELGLRVSCIRLGEKGTNTPMYLFPVRLDNSTQSVVNTGYILYSLSPEKSEIYIDNPLGILTVFILDRCIIEWRDDDHNLITSVTLPVILLPQITQTFYAYNNNSTTPPSYLQGIGASYLHSNWTPNDYGLVDWSLVRKGVTDEFTIEWALTRTRTSSVWELLSNPIISARWGLDGISSDTKLILYTYTSTLITNPVYFETSRKLLDVNVPAGTLQVLDESYTFSKITWYKCYKDVSLEDRYCYVSERSFVIENGKKVYGNWTYPALYSNYSVDGKDGSNVEYIYCRSESSILSDEAKNEFNRLKFLYTTTYDKSGGEIDFSQCSYWTNNPNGVSTIHLTEFCSSRTISYDIMGNAIYGSFVDPFIWASFGELGPDGPGLEYIYILTDGSIPSIDLPELDINNKSFLDDDYLPTGWSDNPLEVTNVQPVLWMSLRKGSYGAWEDFSNPVVWNKFSLIYELRLSNDNCSIPASSTGIYSTEAARLATLTKVELYLGQDLVENYELELPEGYEEIGDTIYALNNTNVSIDISYHAEFKAKIDGLIVATKSLSVILNRGKESYSLFCYPNSRIWYGGNDYSSTLFNLKVYHLSEAGEYRAVSNEELNQFQVGYLYSSEATPIITSFPSKFLTINEGYQDDVIITLRNKDGEILDTEIIDSVDYSKIKGKDNNGVIFAYQENINIPKKQKNNLSYIKKATETTIKAYIGVTPLEITISDVKVNNLEDLSLTVVVGSLDNTYYINQALPGNLSVIYTVNVTTEDNIMSGPTKYDLVLNINLVEEAVVYELFPSVGHLVCNLLTGVNVDGITFSVISSDDSTFNYNIRCYYKNNSDEFEELNNTNYFSFSDEVLTYLKGLSSTTYLNFHLIVDGQLRDVETIPVSPEPEVKGHYYSIDLSNPYVQLPIGLSNDVVTDWTKNEIKVYLNSTKVPSDTEVLSDGDYPKFSVTSDDTNVVINGGNTHWGVQPNESKLVHFTITVLEDELTTYTFTKSQLILLVNSVVYSLSSNPTTIVANPGAAGSFTYTPLILKILLGKIELVTDLLAEGLLIGIDNNKYSESVKIEYGPLTQSISVGLYRDNVIYDYDTITIVRNGEPGADGLSVKYVYGRVTGGNGVVVNTDTLKDDPIKDYNALTFKSSDLSLSILTWSEDPKGISESYPLEFISLSVKTDTEWVNFSTPVLYAQFGLKGEDGNGVEYLFTACKNLLTESGTNGGFNVTGTVLNSLGTAIEGCSELITDDDYKINGWFDNIPNLDREYPNLYMTMRRKINGKWGYFSLPVLWNLYSSKLDLFIDNDNIIIDDNSDSTTIQELTKTNISINYRGSFVSINNDNLKVSLSQELQSCFRLNKSGSSISLSLLDNATLTPTYGLITYTYTVGSDTVSKKLSIYVKDFSVGEGYKLILQPNIIAATFNDNQYSWSTTPIKISLTKIQGTNSSDVSFSATGFKLYVNNNEINSDRYTVLAGSNTSVTPLVFSVKKNGVIVDSLSVSFSTKGADGETPLLINLVNDSDSIIINSDISTSFNTNAVLLAYYNGLNVTLDCKWSVIITEDLPDGISISPFLDVPYELPFTIHPSWYKSNSLISIPLSISCTYLGKTYYSLHNYRIYVLNDIIKRELVPSVLVIKYNGSIYSPTTISCSIKEYSNGTILNTNTLPEGLSFSIRDSNNNAYNIGLGEQLTLKGTLLFIDFTLSNGDLTIDYERIPVVRDGKNGTNGTNGIDGADGKSAYIKMCGVWLPGVLYYCNAAVLGSDNLQTDVVSYQDNSSVKYYQAKLTHISSELNKPSSVSTAWDEVAFSELTLTLELFITNKDGKITGGFVDIDKALNNLNNDTGDGIILWAGASGSDLSNLSAVDATFSVTKSGVIKAKKGLFEGMYAPGLNVIDTFKLSEEIDFRYAYFDGDTITFPKALDLSQLSDSIYCKWGVNNNIFVNTNTKLPVALSGEYLSNVGINFEDLTSIILPTGFLFKDYNDSHLHIIDKYYMHIIGYLQNEDLVSDDDYNELKTDVLNPVFTGWLTNLSSWGTDETLNLLGFVKKYKEKLQKYMAVLFKKALPYVGKKLVIINTPGIYGVWPDSAESFDAFDFIDYKCCNQCIDSGQMVIVECKMTYLESAGYCIYWQLVYTDEGSWSSLDTEALSIPKLTIN